MRKNTPKYVISLAKDLRQRQTDAEKLIWERVRNNKLNGLKFYRQCPIGRYIADFYCVKLRLVIELDGGIHDEERQKIYDEIRQKAIESRKLIVLRIKNEVIIGNIEGVLDTILSYTKPDKNPYTVKRKNNAPYLQENLEYEAHKS
jgi:very-short-patch-repair endonuclease